MFKVLKLRSTPGTILELIFTNFVNITQDISGGKKLRVPNPEMTRENKTRERKPVT